MSMTLNPDGELDQALTELAESDGISKDEVIRRAVLQERDRRERSRRIDLIAADAVIEYKEALDRLGTV